ncbi:virulence factor TspB C-terminal domain-related protein (plasmid) [Photobacterium sp. DA100]|uniref:virulence factor TspB C-terminal domain-related protein n=1 Tax=Photobacterium sp. DA100 TaxID=3027472 RepID=UPI00247B1F72|nr:virulence factor TspB C-terminal domain-related protein [Photobacterium sp. DA100]WEM45789.1 virulence factor TspB C-terminal domain-related protein [Photobacterium sp. DA100]
MFLRVIIFTLLLFSANSYSSDYYWVTVPPLSQGYLELKQYPTCDAWFAKHKPNFDTYPNAKPLVDTCKPSPIPDHPYLQASLAWGFPSKHCPEGSTHGEYPSTECVPDNYCSSEQFNQDKQAAEQQCFDGLPENHNMNFSASCNAETQSANFQCDYIPIDDCIGPDCGGPDGGGPDGGGPDGGGPDGGGPDGGGPDGGGPDGGGPDGGGPDGGGPDGGGPDGGGPGEMPDFCRDNPDVCLYPPDDPACIENPALCDVEPSEDVLAAIRQVTAAIKDQHYNTNVAIKNNTTTANNIANDILSSSEYSNKQITALIDANMVSNDLAIEGNDLMAKNTNDVVKSVSDGTDDIVKAVDKGTDQLKKIKQGVDDVNSTLLEGFCERNKDHSSCQSKKADITKCAEFVCEGEPVLCNLLRLEHAKQCYEPDFKGIDSGIDAIIAAGENADFVNPDVLDFSNPDTKYLNSGVSLSSSCPSPISASVLGETVEFSYQPLCDLAKYLQPFIIAIAWLVAALTVGRGIGNL